MFPNYNNQNQNSGNNNQQSFSEKAKLWWAQVPLFVRFIMTTTITFYILSWFVGTFTKALTNLPALVIYYFQIWRLFTSVFVTLSIFNILFAFLSWVPDAIRLESSTGTMKYMCTFFMNSLLIQLLYVVLCLFFSLFSNQFLVMPSSGLWPLIMAEITILCLNNPQNQLMMMFLPCLIPAKYYPWALFAFFSVLNMNLQFDILAGILYGYLFHHYLKTKIQISDEFVTKMENFPLLNKLQGINSFVSLSKAISQSGGNAFFVGQSSNVGLGASNNRSNNNNASSAAANQIPSRPQAPVSTPFQGKGSILGCKFNYFELINFSFFLYLILRLN